MATAKDRPKKTKPCKFCGEPTPSIKSQKIPFFFKQRADRYPEQGKELDGRKWEQYPFEW